METLVANLGKPQKRIMGGKQYYVAPMTMLSEGVLNGSKGPLFYPSEEISKVVDHWNGIPITNGHPHQSARRPDIASTYQIGTVYNTNFSSGKLVAEAWFDIALLERIEPRILNALEQAKPIELSTGLFTTNEPHEGTYNSRRYSAIARNYRPDHLAILIDTKGACSVEDGCGVLNQLSYDDIKSQLRDQLRSANPTEENEYVYLVDVFKNAVIYERGNSYFRQKYTVSNDQVMLDGTPERVIKQVKYIKKTTLNEEQEQLPDEPIDNVTDNAGCECKKKPTKNKRQSITQDIILNSMSMTERILNGCGANSPGGGGFRPGNTCSKGGGKGGGTRKSASKGSGKVDLDKELSLSTGKMSLRQAVMKEYTKKSDAQKVAKASGLKMQHLPAEDGMPEAWGFNVTKAFWEKHKKPTTKKKTKRARSRKGAGISYSIYD